MSRRRRRNMYEEDDQARPGQHRINLRITKHTVHTTDKWQERKIEHRQSTIENRIESKTIDKQEKRKAKLNWTWSNWYFKLQFNSKIDPKNTSLSLPVQISNQNRPKPYPPRPPSPPRPRSSSKKKTKQTNKQLFRSTPPHFKREQQPLTKSFLILPSKIWTPLSSHQKKTPQNRWKALLLYLSLRKLRTVPPHKTSLTFCI